MTFKWTESLETGYELIDNEHRQLIKAANELMEACAQGKGRLEIEWAAEYLSSYTKTHFEHEEELQLKFKYPDYPAQKCWHKSYVLEIENLMEKLKNEGSTLAVVGAVNRKISELLIHIKTCDLDLARFIQNGSN